MHLVSDGSESSVRCRALEQNKLHLLLLAVEELNKGWWIHLFQWKLLMRCREVSRFVVMCTNTEHWMSLASIQKWYHNKLEITFWLLRVKGVLVLWTRLNSVLMIHRIPQIKGTFIHWLFRCLWLEMWHRLLSPNRENECADCQRGCRGWSCRNRFNSHKSTLEPDVSGEVEIEMHSLPKCKIIYFIHSLIPYFNELNYILK